MSNKALLDHANAFSDLLMQIQQTRQRVFAEANTALIELYWHIGQTISDKVAQAGWGKGVVTDLARYIAQNAPDLKGFSDKNLWRMKQFYLSLAIQEKYSFRVLDRQISSSLFERQVLAEPKLSTALREIHPAVGAAFKDQYVLEFLGLPDSHSESDLQSALIRHMKLFVLELGKDFLFVGEKCRLQVGSQDFFIDLLFYHRGLSALVAFELKIGQFMPQHMGQLNFYLEALDRDVKKPHENPSIGVLLCRDKDDEVVEYALSRNLSPTLIAQYQLQLPDKKLLQARLHELLVDL